MSFHITSEAFEPGQAIPTRYTCDGEDVSPPLAWSEPPEGTVSFALIMDDPDAPVGTWVHWVHYNVPGDAERLEEGVPTSSTLPDGSRNGTNSWGRTGYGGPCPPRGSHRYFFKLYALDRLLDLPPGATKLDLLDEMDGHVLDTTELMGVYAR
jgi:Raf kinase inhibitor-like YbhB/YbcL family protein